MRRCNIAKDGDEDWHYEPMLLGYERSVGSAIPRCERGQLFLYFAGVGGSRSKRGARDLVKKADAGQDLALDLRAGAQFLAAAAKRANAYGCRKIK